MKALRIILAAFLALLVLVSSTSFMVGMHVCMGRVKNVAVFNKAESCRQESMMRECPAHTRPSCCKDVAVVHEATDINASLNHIQIAPPAPIDITLPVVIIPEVIPSVEISGAQHYNYDPPLPPNDLTVSLKVFLI